MNVWICCECGSDSIHGGVRQTSKRYGQAGRCYFCDKPVKVKLISEKQNGDYSVEIVVERLAVNQLARVRFPVSPQIE